LVIAFNSLHIRFPIDKFKLSAKLARLTRISLIYNPS